jgi:UPF0176 protein
VADGLVDETFDVTNIWNSLGGELEDQIRLWYAKSLQIRRWTFYQSYKTRCWHFSWKLPIIEEQLAEHKQDKKTIDVLHWGIVVRKAGLFQTQGFENVYQLEDGIIEYTPSKSWRFRK